MTILSPDFSQQLNKHASTPLRSGKLGVGSFVRVSLKLLFSLSLIYLAATRVRADFESWRSPRELRSIAVDNRYVWVGTWSDGLKRYDKAARTWKRLAFNAHPLWSDGHAVVLTTSQYFESGHYMILVNDRTVPIEAPSGVMIKDFEKNTRPDIRHKTLWCFTDEAVYKYTVNEGWKKIPLEKKLIMYDTHCRSVVARFRHKDRLFLSGGQETGINGGCLAAIYDYQARQVVYEPWPTKESDWVWRDQNIPTQAEDDTYLWNVQNGNLMRCDKLKKKWERVEFLSPSDKLDELPRSLGVLRDLCILLFMGAMWTYPKILLGGGVIFVALFVLLRRSRN